MSYRKLNDKLNAATEAREMASEESPVQVCGHCGQAFDARIMGEVHHHLQPVHQPL